MSFVSSSKRVARKAALQVVFASALCVTMLASSRAHAELLRPNIPTLTWIGAHYAWMPAHESRSAMVTRPSILWTPTFSAFSIGVLGQAAFHSSTYAMLAPFGARTEPWSLCIGPACPGRDGAKADAATDPDTQAKAGSLRLIHGLGPMAVAALGLFSSPVATEAHPLVMRVAPMFAFGGGGLEMRCAWW